MAFRAGGLRYPPQSPCSVRPAKARKLPRHANLVESRSVTERSGATETVHNGRGLSSQRLEPSYSNNVVGGSIRRKLIDSNGLPTAKRLKVAVDVDEGDIHTPARNLQNYDNV